jgi:hypothetical protein
MTTFGPWCWIFEIGHERLLFLSFAKALRNAACVLNVSETHKTFLSFPFLSAKVFAKQLSSPESAQHRVGFSIPIACTNFSEDKTPQSNPCIKRNPCLALALVSQVLTLHSSYCLDMYFQEPDWLDQGSPRKESLHSTNARVFTGKHAWDLWCGIRKAHITRSLGGKIPSLA